MTDDIAAPAAKARSLDAFLPAGERTDAHIVDVTLIIDGTTLRSRASGSSYQAALDEVVDKVESK